YLPRLSPLITADATGSIHLVGPLADFDRLRIDATVDSVDIRRRADQTADRSTEYAIRNVKPIRVSFADRRIRVEELELVDARDGRDTRVRVAGTVGLRDERIALHTEGTVNLAGLPDVATLHGQLRDLLWPGDAGR